MTVELVARAQHGDHDAFERLVRPAYGRLFAVAHRILRDSEAAEDAVQEAIVRAWRDLRTLRDAGRFDAWLYRLLVNQCRDETRRRQRRVAEATVLPIDANPDRDALDALVGRDELARAFRRLSVEHRAALVLTHYLGFPAGEVAAILGVPIGTVYSRLHYAAAAMRAALGAPAAVRSPEPENVR